MAIVSRFKLIILIFSSSLSLNIIAPNIKEISNELNLKQAEGYFAVGGINYLLIYLPMSLSSLFLFFKKTELGISPFFISLFIGILNILIPFSYNLLNFTILNSLVGFLYGLLVPTIYSSIKKINNTNKEMISVGLINISIGLAIAVGQYLSGLLGHFYAENGWKLCYGLIGGIVIIYSSSMLLNHSPQINKGVFEKNPEKTIQKNKLYYALLLLQYIPGSIPWGALNVYIFPFMEKEIAFSKLEIANLITIFGAGMIFGTFSASLIGDKIKQKKYILLLLIGTFILSEISILLLLKYMNQLKFISTVFVLFFSGILLAFPGTYIKGILFMDLNEIETQKIFSVENFLESLGKGLGPFVIGILIFFSNDILSAMLWSVMFWNISILLIVAAYYFDHNKELNEI